MHGVVNRFIVGLAQLLRVPPRPVKAVRPDFALGLLTVGEVVIEFLKKTSLRLNDPDKLLIYSH